MLTQAWSLDGLPAHPLIVHVPVVLLPLLGIALAIWPWIRSRRRLDLFALLSVLVGLAAAVVAVASGERLGDDLGSRRVMGEHAKRGELVRLVVAVLAVVVIARLIAVRRIARSRVTAKPTAVRVLSVSCSLVALGLIPATFRAGHSGAEASWRARYGGRGAVTGSRTSPTSSITADSTSASDRDSVVLTADPGVVNVAIGEWSVVVDRPVARSGPLTFRIRNAGTRPHAFRIRSPGGGGDRAEFRTDAIKPGESVELLVTLGEGSWELDCPLEDDAGEHDALGMEAPFAARADAPDITTTSKSVSAAGKDVSPIVTIRGFAFVPETARIRAGQSVTWTNSDASEHTATGDGFDTGHLNAGDQGTKRFPKKGTYTYVCTIHPSMKGTIVVA